jgi:predicted RNA-binding protein with RPS1 domain
MARDHDLTTYLSPPLREWLSGPVGTTTDPDLLTLAAVLCTPPIVPYRLLRRMRRSLLPQPDTLGVEAAVCSAWFVETIAADGFAFEHDFAQLMRERLRDGIVRQDLRADLAGLRHIIEQETVQLSPLLRLEEQLCWAYIAHSDFAPAVDAILSDIVRTIVREKRTRMLTWASGAFARLPAITMTGPGAWILAQLCEAAYLPHPVVEWPPDGVDEALLNNALTLVPDTLVGIQRDGSELVIGTVTVRRKIALPLPAVTPKFVSVKWDSNASRIWLDPATEVARIPVGRSAVEIRDMRGRTYRLAEFSGHLAPEDEALELALTEVDRRWRQREGMDATGTRVVGGGKGIIVSLDDPAGITAFLPGSRAGAKPASLVDARLRVRIINFDRRALSVVVERIPETVEPPWSTGTLAVGDEFTAPVTSIVNFGVFVSVAEAAGFSSETTRLDGLVHLSELAWMHIDHPSDVVSIGDILRVRVIYIDPERKRIGLSVKQTQPDPIALLAASYQIGERVVATVSKVVPFGWFLHLPEEGIDGLLHLSEAPDGTVFEAGDQTVVWLLGIDVEQRRIAFTLRPPPWEAI